MHGHCSRHPRRSAGQTSRAPHACTSKARVARYYDPTTAQFLTRDPVEQMTRQAYTYASGDPLDLSDPSGLCNKNPLSGGFWTQGNCLSDAATYVYNTDVDWYSCHGGWKTFAAIDIGAMLVAAGVIATGGWGLPAAVEGTILEGGAVGATLTAGEALASEGAFGYIEFITHGFAFVAPPIAVGTLGLELILQAVKQPARSS